MKVERSNGKVSCEERGEERRGVERGEREKRERIGLKLREEMSLMIADTDTDS